MISVKLNSVSFEISKVYTIRLQRYRNFKILVCGKDSIPNFTFIDNDLMDE